MPASRLASEVILDIEQRLHKLEGMINAIDFNIKLLLNDKNIQSRPSPTSLPSNQATVPLTASVEAVEFVQEPIVTLKPPVKRVVQESITYSDSKVIVLAQVEIFDANETNGKRKLIDKVRTNNAGKWTASLFPGAYVVRIAKQATSLKPQVSIQYEINVPVSNKPLSLPARKID
ncbi:MAG: hypothetical protein Q8P20_00505 [bacterium]|nr:hypothetical protein [bacterium]